MDLDDPLVYHRLIEAEKFAYAQRSKLGDVAFVESAKTLVANMTTRLKNRGRVNISVYSKYSKWIASLIKDTAQPIDYYLGNTTSQVQNSSPSPSFN